MSTRTTDMIRVAGDAAAVPAAVGILWADYLDVINEFLTSVMTVTVIVFTLVRIYYMLKNHGKNGD